MNKRENKQQLKLQEEAKLETTTPERLRELASQSDTLAQIVASNIATPPELLKKLSSHSKATVSKAVVSNPNTPPKTLFKLGEYFPQALLNNPVFNLLFLEKPDIIESIPFPTLYSLINQKNAPPFLLKCATHHKNYNIAETAKLHINLAGEMSSGWHEAAQKIFEKIPYSQRVSLYHSVEDAISKTGYNSICDSGFWMEKYLIAVNFQTPEDVIKLLAKDFNRIVRATAKENLEKRQSLLKK